ncbi:proteasome assembly chaperone 3 [Nitzschia inconspicua]|uniref:Proteasome assembly chaperone 3 n=1 Tax=Nitzschia inconspicua TaxID=303405 RepID=A0A9K3K469_9STRA|nr:proteasome assembly chaperone 3 [Nitzschia inconspicua]KAG7344835.1 proteasome assembly chaperone 3 [Nitzschia inconspicua]
MNTTTLSLDKVVDGLSNATITTSTTPTEASSAFVASATAVPVEQCLPTTITRSYRIQGVPAHTFCQIFGDRIVVGVTQLQSQHIGNWVTCQATLSAIDPKAIEWDVATVLGDHQDVMLEVYARRLVDCIVQRRLIPGTNQVSLLLGLSLLKRPNQQNKQQKQEQEQPVESPSEDNDRERFRLLVDALVGLVSEAVGVALYASNNNNNNKK